MEFNGGGIFIGKRNKDNRYSGIFLFKNSLSQNSIQVGEFDFNSNPPETYMHL